MALFRTRALGGRRLTKMVVGAAIVVVSAGVIGPGVLDAQTTTTVRPAPTNPPTTARASANPANPAVTAGPTSAVPPAKAPQNLPFPAALVAPVLFPGDRPETAVASLYKSVSLVPGTTDVVVRFKQPFALPRPPYKLSVLVGDPTGERTRVSMVSQIPPLKPRGTVEVFNGTTWRDAGNATVLFDPSGYIVVRVPTNVVPGQGAAWCEVTPVAGELYTTPYYSHDALFGDGVAGLLPSGRFGRVYRADGTPTPEVATLPAGPVTSVSNRVVTVRYDLASPGELLGHRVNGAFDILRIAPNFDTGGVFTALVRINRNDGSIQLFDGPTLDATDRSGSRDWLLRTLPAGHPGDAGSVTVDLQAVSDAVGAPLPPDTTAVGLSRSYTLDDGRTINADAVLATSVWFDLGPTVAPPTPTTVAAPAPAPEAVPTAEEVSSVVPLVIGVVLLVGLAVLAGALVRRRRPSAGPTEGDGAAAGERAAVSDPLGGRPQSGDDRVPWGRSDGVLTANASAEMEKLWAESAAEPVPEPPAAADVVDGNGTRPVIAGEPVTDVVARQQAARESEPVEPAPVEPEAPQQRINPSEALAAMDLDLNRLKARLDHLEPEERSADV
jgi:hypothetical protein